MYCLPGFLGTGTAISQTPAFNSLQMGSTSYLGAQTNAVEKPSGKSWVWLGRHTEAFASGSPWVPSPGVLDKYAGLRGCPRNAALSAIHYHGSKPLGRKRRQRELGRICLQWGLETRDTPDWAYWLDVVWPRSNGMNRMTFTGLHQLSGSMKRDFWFTPRLYTSDSEIFLDSCQESKW